METNNPEANASEAEALRVFRNPEAPRAARAQAIIPFLTLEEKTGLMCTVSPPVERLGLPAVKWGGEGLHGLANAGRATVFPQALMLAATFDEDLLTRVGEAVSDEVRAKFHLSQRAGREPYAPGLMSWSPNLNLFRDPRWGRGQETYGEDPCLTARLGVAFIRAMQGGDAQYLKVGCGVKHFAVHSGPDALRHRIDPAPSAKDLWETYLPAFEAAVREAGAAGVMGAYNKLNGEPCCASPKLLGEILRGGWGFEGIVLSDGGALDDLHHAHAHAVTANEAESAVYALERGCDLCLGQTYRKLPEAVRRGLTSEVKVDEALTRLLMMRLRLGIYDPPERLPWAGLPPEIIDCDSHRELARTAARESMVLLKNDGVLPLRPGLRSLAVVGPNCADAAAVLGNYTGYSGRIVTPLEGLTARAEVGTRIIHARGCDLRSEVRAEFDFASGKAGRAEVIVAVLGMTSEIEGEEFAAPLADHVGDRLRLALPGVQELFLERLFDTGKPVVLVLTGCAPMAVVRAMSKAAAVVHMGYGGEGCGTALAELLFGDANFCGRLPVTWPTGVGQLPPFEDYAMAGRTYRYMTRRPLLPFGFGLSYTRFEYGDLSLSAERVETGRPVTARAKVTNVGERAGKEAVQAYLTDVEASCRVPLRSLVGFRKVELGPGQSAEVEFEVDAARMALVDEAGRRVVEPGAFRLTVGGSQGDALSQALTGQAPLTAEFVASGKAVELPG